MKKILTICLLGTLMLSLIAGCAIAQGLQNVELHGYMLNRMYGNPDSSARFVTERISLNAVGQLGKDGTAYIEVYFHPFVTDAVIPGSKTPGNPPLGFTAEQGRTYLESAYLDLPLGEGRIRIGKGRQLNFGLTPTYPNRKTTQYGILSETFTQDRIQGFQYTYKKGAFDAGASVFTDLPIEARKIGDFANVEATKVVPHFVEKDDSANSSGRIGGSMKVGFATPCWTAHASGAIGKLTPNDADFVAAPFTGSTTTNRDHNKYGFDAGYVFGPFTAQAEWYRGTFSILKITGYSMTVGYQPKDARRVYLRYAALDNNLPPNTNPLTWNTSQLTLGIVQPIRKGVWAEFQYERNMERQPAGVARVDNDLLFLEFFTGF